MAEKIKAIEVTFKGKEYSLPPHIIKESEYATINGQHLNVPTGDLTIAAKVYFLPDRIRVFETPGNISSEYQDYFPGDTVHVTVEEEGGQVTYTYKIT